MVPLWQYFLQNDLDGFQKLLADATFNCGSQKVPGSHVSHKNNSLTLPSTSPRNTFMKSRKSLDYTIKAISTPGKPEQHLRQVNLSRADVNAKDVFGRTILHLAASSANSTALGFVETLLRTPLIDPYVQDLESGWTPLHRALYHGHIQIAQALMLKDIHDLTDYTSNMFNHPQGGLIKIKDHEGNSPFELFSLTIAPRDLLHSHLAVRTVGSSDDDSVASGEMGDSGTLDRSKRLVKAEVNLLGDEVFAFGSNKNLSLGLGDEDDRQFPERITLTRPEHLLHRLHFDAQARREKELDNQDLSSRRNFDNALPAVIRNQPLVIQDVVMSKLHTAVLTTDPVSNLYVCGFGPGGRLGTGDESTRFSYVCLQTGGLAKKRVAVVALGQDHSIAVSEQGEVFAWGSNKYGQLGYSLPDSSTSKDNPMQLTPRQLFGPMKKELIIGAAASSLHSAIFTSSALYTFGKNEGQLGLMDADARSLEVQVTPRRVGVSILQSSISMVCAIDRATTILLESHDVVVLTHFGWTRVLFPLEGFANYFLHGTSGRRNAAVGNYISKVTAGGNTLCALSTYGEIFTVDVTKKPDSSTTNQSTTNPSKARNALPQPSKLWSIGKSHMSAKDVAVGQDGSIILCTVSGSVWRKEKRTKIKETSGNGSTSRTRDYKFARIPNITRAVGIKSNAFGAYTAIRKDCVLTREQIIVDPPTIWDVMSGMLPFRDLASPTEEDSDTENPRPRFWTPASSSSSPVHVKQAVLHSADIESQIQKLPGMQRSLAKSQYDLWIMSTVNDIKLPAHSFLVKARSVVLRHALTEFQNSYYFSIPDVLSIEYGPDGHIQLQFQGFDFLSILNYVFYLYTENIIDVWHHTQRKPHMAPRFRQIRTELMKIGANLEMRCLERAARVMTEPARCLNTDMEMAFTDPDFFSNGDVLIELADGIEVPAHSALLSNRCPFFEGLFFGRAGGLWLTARRGKAEEMVDVIRVDLKHVEEPGFRMVLRHIYADTGEELFDDVVTADLNEFIDLVIEVMAVGNELMLDRLTQVCQKVLGQYVTTRNVCQLLNAVAPCSVDEFKHAGLEYICLNLETMLEHRLLEELDDDLLAELDGVVQENQLAYLPLARSGRAEAELLDQHPELSARMEEGKQRILDSLRLRSVAIERDERSRLKTTAETEGPEYTSLKPRQIPTNQQFSDQSKLSATHSGSNAKPADSDLVFEMEDGLPAGDLYEQDAASIQLNPKTVNDDGRADALYSARVWGSERSGTRSKPQGLTVARERFTPSASWSRSPLEAYPKANTPAAGSDASSKPWNGPLAGLAKTGLKDIMSQAASSRTSNLTLAMSREEVRMEKVPPKLSQRERKKIQHQQTQENVPITPSQTGTNSDSPSVSKKPTSPWLGVPLERKPPLTPATPPVIPGARQQATRSMTMRQTVAGTPTTPKEGTSPKPGSHPRSVSNPIVAKSSKSTPQIQSIRHNPTRPIISSSPSSALHSMTDILAEQQGEKTAIKKAAAKRSLQEIQQEQEFQEWWDNESKRVQEEEQAAANATARGKGGRGRGARRKASGRGGRGQSANRDTAGSSSAEGPPCQEDGVVERTRRVGRGQRGSSRGH
jgi:inhibitor of Bruton tyrosine kinase